MMEKPELRPFESRYDKKFSAELLVSYVEYGNGHASFHRVLRVDLGFSELKQSKQSSTECTSRMAFPA